MKWYEEQMAKALKDWFNQFDPMDTHPWISITKTYENNNQNLRTMEQFNKDANVEDLTLCDQLEKLNEKTIETQKYLSEFFHKMKTLNESFHDRLMGPDHVKKPPSEIESKKEEKFGVDENKGCIKGIINAIEQQHDDLKKQLECMEDKIYDYETIVGKL